MGFVLDATHAARRRGEERTLDSAPAACGSRTRFNARAFRATRMLDPDIAMAPIAGLRVKPKL
jgi:hypothetical protein